ncbi:MAG: hypothetical protein SFW08_11845 [Gemmatimonadaceae bacterium]|nr:hypothetical protein [Gemmatimonadaceae bacterium]
MAPRRTLVALAGRALLLCIALGAVPAVAQTSPDRVAQIIGQARLALDDLEYARAISICRLVLQQPSVTAEQRRDALIIIAAAQFPNDPEAARPDSAAVTLRQLVKLDLDATLPRAISWRGLDSLLTLTKGRVLSFRITTDSAQRIAGSDGTWRVQYRSTIDADLSLVAERGGTVVQLARARGKGGEVRIPVYQGDRPLLADGEWKVTFAARAAGDAEVRSFVVAVVADTLQPLEAPVFDSTALKPEFAPPLKAKALGFAAVLGGATIAIASGLRASDPVRSAASADGRAMGVAALMTAGAATAMFLDRGRRLPDNVADNARRRREFDAEVAQVNAEKARRLGALTATVRTLP